MRQIPLLGAGGRIGILPRGNDVHQHGQVVAGEGRAGLVVDPGGEPEPAVSVGDGGEHRPFGMVQVHGDAGQQLGAEGVDKDLKVAELDDAYGADWGLPGIGPIAAVPRVLQRTGMRLDDLDLIDAVADTTDASITARVWAGGESAIRQVDVRVLPGTGNQ